MKFFGYMPVYHTQSLERYYRKEWDVRKWKIHPLEDTTATFIKDWKCFVDFSLKMDKNKVIISRFID